MASLHSEGINVTHGLDPRARLARLTYMRGNRMRGTAAGLKMMKEGLDMADEHGSDPTGSVTAVSAANTRSMQQADTKRAQMMGSTATNVLKAQYDKSRKALGGVKTPPTISATGETPKTDIDEDNDGSQPGEVEPEEGVHGAVGAPGAAGVSGSEAPGAAPSTTIIGRAAAAGAKSAKALVSAVSAASAPAAAAAPDEPAASAVDAVAPEGQRQVGVGSRVNKETGKKENFPIFETAPDAQTAAASRAKAGRLQQNALSKYRSNFAVGGTEMVRRQQQVEARLAPGEKAATEDERDVAEGLKNSDLYAGERNARAATSGKLALPEDVQRMQSNDAARTKMAQDIIARRRAEAARARRYAYNM